MASTSKAKMKVGEYTVDLANHIGSGAVGMVHPATDANGYKVAAKRICKREEEIIRKITRDLNKLPNLDHANIAKYENVQNLIPQSGFSWNSVPTKISMNSSGNVD